MTDWMRRLSRRQWNLAGFAVCAALLGYGYYLQYGAGLVPCPLCIFQRASFAALGIVFLAAALHNPGVIGSRIYGVLGLIAAGAGVALAIRHLYLQNLPPELAPPCGPSLDYMLEAFPLSRTLELVLRGSGECTSVEWSFLGLTLPGWALVWFVLLGLAMVVRNSLPDRPGPA